MNQCKHPRVQIVSRDEDTEYVECLECGDVFESSEFKDMAIEESTAMSARTDGMLAGREASELLQAALQKLSPELRETVILRDLEELEYREIAQVLNVPEGTVKSRLNRGRAELARVLRRNKVRV